MAETAEISVLELRRLLVELRDKRPDICIRFRLLGQMWLLHFMRIILVTDRGVVLNNEVSNRLVTVRDLNNVIQFEIDNRFQNYRPHYHYDVTNRIATMT